MNQEELIEIFNLLSEIDFKNISINENILLMSATYEFAEKVKPIVMKYSMENHTKSTFFMKLGDDCMNKSCETCRYYEYESIDDGYVCVNSDSEYCSDWVEPEHCCEDWSKKDD